MAWEKPFKTARTLTILEDLSARLALRHATDCNIQHLLQLIRKKDYKAIVALEVDYNEYGADNILALCAYRQMLAFYQKSDFLDLGVDKELTAFLKWRKAEEACAETNRIFRSLDSGVTFLPEVAVLLSKTRLKIDEILGYVPPLHMLDLKYGPGATSSVEKKDASIQKKLGEHPTCSEQLLRSHLLPSLVRELPHWMEQHQIREYVDEDGYAVGVLDFRIEPSRLMFVPKSAKTLRSIILQPTLDSLFQLGIGRYIADRLRIRARVDIRDQTKNQRLAKLGSLNANFHGSDIVCISTVDLQSASDSIAKLLVKYLLREDWYALLNACRPSDVTTTYGLRFELEAFSSMGNGFTFPLETLIFYAMAHSVMSSMRCTSAEWDVLSVYGDDIIIPTRCFETLKMLFHAVGFSINLEKSFTTGGFRESCGADFHFGFDVRPVYVKERLSPEALFVLHNFFVRNYDGEMAQAVLSFIPEKLRLFGPDGLGDGHLVSHEYAAYRTREMRRRGWGGYYFKSYRHIPCEHPSLFPGDVASPYYVLYRRAGGVKSRQAFDRLIDRRCNYQVLLEHQCLREWWRELDHMWGLIPTGLGPVRQDGRATYSLPGSSGVEVASIYTFHAPAI